MKALVNALRIVLFIVLSTLNFEYLINRQSSTLLLLTSIVLEIVLFYFLIFKLIKQYFL